MKIFRIIFINAVFVKRQINFCRKKKNYNSSKDLEYKSHPKHNKKLQNILMARSLFLGVNILIDTEIKQQSIGRSV